MKAQPVYIHRQARFLATGDRVRLRNRKSVWKVTTPASDTPDGYVVISRRSAGPLRLSPGTVILLNLEDDPNL